MTASFPELQFNVNGLLEITDGLAEFDKVITTGQQILKHETIVEIVGQEDQVAEEKKPLDKGQSPSSLASNP